MVDQAARRHPRRDRARSTRWSSPTSATFPLPVGAFCSSHWFDFHPSGIVAAGFYGGGTQFIDVRDPRELTSYGHATWGASEVWDSYWMPVYSKAGKMTAKKTNLAYSVDLARGIDVYRVDLPGTTWDTSTASIAPVGTGWTTGGPALVALSAILVALGVRRRTAHRATASALTPGLHGPGRGTETPWSATRAV